MAFWYFYLRLVNIWREKCNKTASEKSPIMLLPLQLLTDRVKTLLWGWYLKAFLLPSTTQALNQVALKLKTWEVMWEKKLPGFSCDVNKKVFLFLL